MCGKRVKGGGFVRYIAVLLGIEGVRRGKQKAADPEEKLLPSSFRANRICKYKLVDS